LDLAITTNDECPVTGTTVTPVGAAEAGITTGDGGKDDFGGNVSTTAVGITAGAGLGVLTGVGTLTGLGDGALTGVGDGALTGLGLGYFGGGDGEAGLTGVGAGDGVLLPEAADYEVITPFEF
jgi:hypothetical protein